MSTLFLAAITYYEPANPLILYAESQYVQTGREVESIYGYPLVEYCDLYGPNCIYTGRDVAQQWEAPSVDPDFPPTPARPLRPVEPAEPVPELGTWALVLAGIAGIFARRRANAE